MARLQASGNVARRFGDALEVAFHDIARHPVRKVRLP
jgi:hypothetical protein